MRNQLAVPRRDDIFFPLEQHFDKFWEEFFSDNPLNSVKGAGSFPKMNIYEHDGELVVTAAVSGMTANELKVEVSPDNVLSISGRMSEVHRKTPENAVVYIRELRGSTFERRLQLPDVVEGEPSAVLKDGILTLRWKLKKEEDVIPTAKRISIQSE